MSGTPFKLDFLQKIKAINFGTTPWCAVLAFANTADHSLANTTATAAFPAMLDGTPGLKLITEQAPISSIVTKKLTTQNMSSTLVKFGDQPLIGFGMGYAGLSTPTHGFTGALLGIAFLRCSGPLSSPCVIEVDMASGSSATNVLSMNVFLWKNSIKAGLKIDFSTGFGDYPPPDAQDNSSVDGTDPFTATGRFAVDPKALTVVVS